MASNPNCTSHLDSVYITVINKPVTPACSPANNTISFSSIPDITSTTTWAYDASWGCRKLSAYQSYGYPELDILFNPYWNNVEPEDGIYSISNIQTFTDASTYSVYISALYQSIYFSGGGSDKVYVTHQNGKLQVTMCGISLTGSLGGPSYKVITTGKLTAP